MNQRVKTIFEEVKKLSPEEQDELSRLLLEITGPDPEIDQAWIEECERRLDAYVNGETRARDAQEVLAKYFKP